MKMRLLSRYRSERNESGSVSVEFALIGSLLILATLGAFELGRVLFTYHNLATAVGATTRLIQMQAPEEAIIEIINSRFSPSERQHLTVEINPNVIIGGAIYTRIDASYALPLIMPNFNLFPGSSYTLEASQLVPTS